MRIARVEQKAASPMPGLFKSDVGRGSTHADRARLDALLLACILQLLRLEALLLFLAHHVELLHRLFHGGLCGLLGGHGAALVRGIAWLALHDEHVMRCLILGGGIAEQHVVHPIQPIALGQHQQAGGHPLAGRVETAPVPGRVRVSVDRAGCRGGLRASV